MRPFTTLVILMAVIVMITTGFAGAPSTDVGPPVTNVHSKQSSLTPGEVLVYQYDMSVSQSLPGVEVAKVTQHDQKNNYEHSSFLKPVTDLTLDPVWVYVRPSSVYTGHLARLHPGFNKPPSYYRKGIRNSKC